MKVFVDVGCSGTPFTDLTVLKMIGPGDKILLIDKYTKELPGLMPWWLPDGASVNLLTAEIENLPLRDLEVDVVFMSNLCGSASADIDIEEALYGISSILNYGGELYILETNSPFGIFLSDRRCSEEYIRAREFHNFIEEHGWSKNSADQYRLTEKRLRELIKEEIEKELHFQQDKVRQFFSELAEEHGLRFKSFDGDFETLKTEMLEFVDLAYTSYRIIFSKERR